MAANIIILALIAGYSIFLIRRGYKNKKAGKHIGCAGCSGECGQCAGCGAHSDPTPPEK